MSFAKRPHTLRSAHAAITGIARFNCRCGHWIVMPRSYTRDAPLVCGGPCGTDAGCGIRHFWEGDHRVVQVVEPLLVLTPRRTVVVVDLGEPPTSR